MTGQNTTAIVGLPPKYPPEDRDEYDRAYAPATLAGQLANDLLLGLHITASTGYRHDFSALRAASARIVGVGAQSGQMMAGRAAVAVAGRLGTTPVTFPGGHDGFLSDPAAFAAVLRTVLDG